MASFGAQPNGKHHFCMLLRYFSLMCIQHTALGMPCSTTKMTVSPRSELVLTGPSMDRRDFFRRGVASLTKAVVEGVKPGINAQAGHWIRPPYALDELDFLLACTRCGACIEACPHDVIFSLPFRSGIKAANTPALDLLHKSCHLCTDWPCVTACEPAALLQCPAPDHDEKTIPLPDIATARIETSQCLPYKGPECGACQGVCPVPEAMVWVLGKPRIDPEHCVGCGLCREACILEAKAISIHSKYQTSEAI